MDTQQVKEITLHFSLEQTKYLDSFQDAQRTVPTALPEVPLWAWVCLQELQSQPFCQVRCAFVLGHLAQQQLIQKSASTGVSGKDLTICIIRSRKTGKAEKETHRTVNPVSEAAWPRAQHYSSVCGRSAEVIFLSKRLLAEDIVTPVGRLCVFGARAWARLSRPIPFLLVMQLL